MSLSSLPTDLQNLINCFLVTEDDIKAALAMWWPGYEDTPAWADWLKGDIAKVQKIQRYGGFLPKDPEIMFNRWHINNFFSDTDGYFACGEVWMDEMPDYDRYYPIYAYLERIQEYLENKGYVFDLYLN